MPAPKKVERLKQQTDPVFTFGLLTASKVQLLIRQGPPGSPFSFFLSCLKEDDEVSSFLRGLTTNDTRGENEMPAHSTSSDPHVDLFFSLGTRGLGKDVARGLFLKSFSKDPTTAMRILFHNRDVLQGRGERQSFRDLIEWLAGREPAVVRALVDFIPEYGRWDDLLSLFKTPVWDSAVETISNGLEKKNGLCAKWMPRKGEISLSLREHLGLTPKKYRKLLVGLTKVVETQMCANEWGSIKYGSVPSKAGLIYRKAFSRHDGPRYVEYLEGLKKGTEKVNVKALYPHEILHSLLGYDVSKDEITLGEEMWKRLGELFPSHKERIIPVCDVSGSMSGLPMEVSVALGIFLSERNTGPFKDCFMTFSAKPRLRELKGRLMDKIQQLQRAEWGMNTDLERCLQVIAKAAKNGKVEDSPTMLLILSDMQFDQCAKNPSNNAMEMIEEEFGEYPVPKIVFWNLRAVPGTLPVKYDEKGTALVSGFSPNILKALVNNPEEFTPVGIMKSVIESERYRDIRV